MRVAQGSWARADLGIAVGAGTDVAIEAARIVLMKSDPLDVLNAIILSRATVRKMKQNLVWASVHNLMAIPVSAVVFYPLWGWSLRPEVFALLMSASSIIVAVNAVMPRRAGSELLVGWGPHPHAVAGVGAAAGDCFENSRRFQRK